MFNILEINKEVLVEAEGLGYIVNDDTYTSEETAEREGFYWVDEFGKWVNIEAVEELTK